MKRITDWLKVTLLIKTMTINMLFVQLFRINQYMNNKDCYYLVDSIYIGERYVVSDFTFIISSPTNENLGGIDRISNCIDFGNYF